MIITVTMNPALDKTVTLPGFAINTVNRVQNVRLDPGGKGINVSKTIKAIGGQTLAMGVLGGASGGYVKAALDMLELPNDFVVTAEPTRTNVKIIDPALGTNTDINEPGSPIPQEVLAKVWEKLEAVVQPGDTVVFAGKNPPDMPDDCLALWIRKLRSMGVRACIDTVGEPLRLALRERADVYKPNREELSELVGRDLRTPNEILDVAQELVNRGIGLVVVSMGEGGAIFVAEGIAIRAYAPKVPVVSTVGAGDAMMAALAHYSAAGCSLEEIARRSVAVSSASVMQSGSQAADMRSILPLIDRVELEVLS